jgi:septum formation protein
VLQEILSYEILLASRSPRRKALLEELGIPFRVVEAGHAEESYPPGLTGGEIASYLAVLKSDAYSKPIGRNEVLLTADTIVWYGDRELGKPDSREEALDMILDLSGNTHQVYTGVCLRTARRRACFYSSTEVSFARVDPEEAAHYVDVYRPYDKAGAYGIQEWIGHIAVESIRGSYFNVMGLPVQRVYSELKKLIGSAGWE